MSTTNRAFRIHGYGGPDVARLDSIDEPTPGPGQVVVAVKAAGINQLDWKIREGHVRNVFHLDLPATIGVEFAGEVLHTGKGTTRFAAGDRVMGFVPRVGSYTEQLLIDEDILARTPDALNDVQAAALPVSAVTAWQAVHSAGDPTATDTVLVHAAAGAVGGWAVQFAGATGARVIATASADNHDFVRDLGADVVIDYRNQNFEDHVDEVDLVVDLVGGDTLDRSWGVLKPGGAIVSVSQHDIVDRTPDARRGYWIEAEPEPALLERIAADAADSKLRFFVAETFPLKRIGEAIELSRTGGYGPGKLVVDFSK